MVIESVDFVEARRIFSLWHSMLKGLRPYISAGRLVL